MSVDLSLIIADLENKIAAADSNTPLLDLLQMITAAERLTGGKNVYDSAGVLPTGNEYIGTIAMTADGTIRVYSGDSGGWDTLDSSSYTAPTPPSHFPGSTSGYTSGGTAPPYSNIIQKFSFTSDANATDVGDLTVARFYVVGQSSSNNGYTTGGAGANGAPDRSIIDKFSFSADGNATDVGDLTQFSYSGSGQSSTTNGYVSGGNNPPTSPNLNVIQKFPFSTDANSTDVGDLTQGRSSISGQSSADNGYVAGGNPNINVIDKFSFAIDGNATDVGDLTVGRLSLTGQSSDISGYSSGGEVSTNTGTTAIDKFPFSTDANATDVGDLLFAIRDPSGQSSTASGYTSGGRPNPPSSPAYSNVIQKFPFSVDANSTDVGDLTSALGYLAGQQV